MPAPGTLSTADKLCVQDAITLLRSGAHNFSMDKDQGRESARAMLGQARKTLLRLRDHYGSAADPQPTAQAMDAETLRSAAGALELYLIRMKRGTAEPVLPVIESALAALEP